jgi:chromosomal replication initiator protein
MGSEATVIDELLDQTAQAFGLPVRALTGRNRSGRVVWARHAAAWVLHRRVPGISLADIGNSLGGRDHTTIMYALDQVPTRRRVHPDYDYCLSLLGV